MYRQWAAGKTSINSTTMVTMKKVPLLALVIIACLNIGNIYNETIEEALQNNSSLLAGYNCQTDIVYGFKKVRNEIF